MSIVSAIMFLIFLVMCFVYCWGHTCGYRDACIQYQIPTNDHEPY